MRLNAGSLSDSQFPFGRTQRPALALLNHGSGFKRCPHRPRHSIVLDVLGEERAVPQLKADQLLKRAGHIQKFPLPASVTLPNFRVTAFLDALRPAVKRDVLSRNAKV